MNILTQPVCTLAGLVVYSKRNTVLGNSACAGCCGQDAEADQASKGEASELHVIIFDEIDAICKARGSVQSGAGVHDTLVNQLLTKIDGVDSLNNILLIGMTNRCAPPSQRSSCACSEFWISLGFLGLGFHRLSQRSSCACSDSRKAGLKQHVHLTTCVHMHAWQCA